MGFGSPRSRSAETAGVRLLTLRPGDGEILPEEDEADGTAHQNRFRFRSIDGPHEADADTEEEFRHMNRRITVALAATAAAGLAAAGAAGPAAAAQKRTTNQLRIVGGVVVKPGKFVKDDQRFAPRV